MTCLENIVGLSRKDCECFDDPRPGDWDTSKSGLFLDELPGLEQQNISASTDCGEGSVWDIMTRALENGTLRFRTDLLSAIKQRYKDRFQPFNGTIGMAVFNGTTPSLDVMHGIRLESNCLKGSCFILKEICAYFDTTTTGLIEVNIYRSGIETPLHTFTIDSEADVKKSNVLPNPIELPLWIDGVDEFNYHIVYDLPGGVKPLNTKLYSCTCKRKNSKWSAWITADGVRGPSFTSTAALDTLSSQTYTYGLNLVSEIKCKKGAIICEDNEEFDFQNDEIALQIAYAIQAISGALLAQELVAAPDTVEVALNEEALIAMGNAWLRDYEERLQYIAVNIEPNNDCFICSGQIAVVGIKA